MSVSGPAAVLAFVRVIAVDDTSGPYTERGGT
jgi:hypothetical protein